MATDERMKWLAARTKELDLYTDHNNLMFIFNPLDIVPDLSKSSRRKFMRWEIWLSY